MPRVPRQPGHSEFKGWAMMDSLGIWKHYTLDSV